MPDPSPIEVRAHPPERRRRQTVTLPCGCCCCCCCCLHTVGGLIGAAIGNTFANRTPPPPPPELLSEGAGPDDLLLPPPRPRVISPGALYWIILAAVGNLTFLISCLGISGGPAHLLEQDEAGPALGGAVLILALFLPAVQLVASVIAMLVAGLTDRPNAAARIWAIGKITLGMLIGTGIGLGIMALLCIPFMA